ncbi:histidine kinase [Dermabacteraceae bacterium P13147]
MDSNLRRGRPAGAAPAREESVKDAQTAINSASSTPRSAVEEAGTMLTQRRRNQSLWDKFFAVFWTVFLLFPLVAIFRSPAPLGYRVLAFTGFAVFAALYVHSILYTSERDTSEPVFSAYLPSTPLRTQLYPIRFILPLLILSAVSTFPAIGEFSLFFLPFVCALVLFTTRLRQGILFSTFLIALTTLAVWLFLPTPAGIWMLFGNIGGAVSALLGRLGMEQGMRETSLAREIERTEISREVHDILGHSLTTLTLKAEVALRLIDTRPEDAKRELAEVLQISRRSLADVRETVTRLRAPNLASQLLASETAFTAAGISHNLPLPDSAVDSLPAERNEVFSWALRELTTNVVRHSQANRVEVNLAPDLLRVRDNGVGCAGAPYGNGLTGMRERLLAHGGTLTLEPAFLGDSASPGTLAEVRFK